MYCRRENQAISDISIDSQELSARPQPPFGMLQRPRAVVAAGGAGLGVLLAATLVAYLPALRNGFVWDDRQYILDNRHVASGLTLENARWALTSIYAGNWHPLTWLSHQLDVQLFGLAPMGHHLVNILLHLLNTTLVFLLLRRMTGAAGRSLLVAAFFALHPLRVESVAWTSERKDVLAASLGLLTVLAYRWYLQTPAVRRYLLVAALFLLGLAAKQTIVMLPLALLLLDYWPLGRFGVTSRGPAQVQGAGAWKIALLEKLPLLGLAAATGLAAFIAQRSGGGVVTLSDVSLAARIENALWSYVAYVRLTVWPSGLSPLHLHPGNGMPWTQAALGAVLLAAATAAALRLRRREPALVVGWLWYLGMLLPVIGIVQAGVQGMAERYTYLPSLGLLIAAVWGGEHLVRSRPAERALLLASAGIAIAGLGVATGREVRIWRDDITLFTRALQVDPQNWYAHFNLGTHLQDLGRLDDAAGHYRAASRTRHALTEKALNNLGVILMAQGAPDETEGLFLAAIRLRPDYANAYDNLGNLYRRQGRYRDAEASFLQAIRLEPGAVGHRLNLGALLLDAGRFSEAETRFAESMSLDPSDADPWKGRGMALLRQGRGTEAAAALREAQRRAPNDQQISRSLAKAEALAAGRAAEAPAP